MNRFKVEVVEKKGETWTQFRFSSKNQTIISEFQTLTGLIPCKVNSRYTYFEIKDDIFKSLAETKKD